MLSKAKISKCLLAVTCIFYLFGCDSEQKPSSTSNTSLSLDDEEAIYLCDAVLNAKGVQEAFPICLEQAKLGNVHAQLTLGKLCAEGSLGKHNIPQARYWLTQAAQSGNQDAFYPLALIYLSGSGTQQDLAQAESLLLLAAEQNDPAAMLKLGDFYREGTLGATDNEQARKWYQLAIAQNDPNAQYQVALLMLVGQWRDIHDPISLLTAAAKQGYAPAQLELAKMYQEGVVVSQNEALAYQWYLAAAAQDEPLACFEIGMSFINGNFNQPRNETLAIQYLKKAAEKYYYPAQYALACLYIEDPSVLKDKYEAMEYLQPAANAGVTDAQVKLAQVLAQFSLPQYDKAAFHWLVKAACEQDPQALYFLASFYQEGIGTEINYSSAFKLYSQLAKEDHYLAQFKLGQMYYIGQGVEPNVMEAKKWVLSAAEHNVPEAQDLAMILKNVEITDLSVDQPIDATWPDNEGAHEPALAAD